MSGDALQDRQQIRRGIVRGARWSMRSALAVLLICGLGVAAGCGGHYRTDSPKTTGVILFKGGVDDASVWIDEKYVADLRFLPKGVRVPVGTHRVQIRHDEFHTQYEIVEVGAGRSVSVRVDMARKLP